MSKESAESTNHASPFVENLEWGGEPSTEIRAMDKFIRDYESGLDERDLKESLGRSYDEISKAIHHLEERGWIKEKETSGYKIDLENEEAVALGKYHTELIGEN